MQKEDQFLKYFLDEELKSLNIGDAETLKTLLSFIGIERLKQFNPNSYSQTDLKKLAGEIISRLHSRGVTQKDRGRLCEGKRGKKYSSPAIQEEVSVQAELVACVSRHRDRLSDQKHPTQR